MRRVALLALLAIACGRGDDRAGSARPDVAPAVQPAPLTPAARVEPAATVTFHPPGRPPARVAVEIAVRPHEISRGLMYREHLPPDAGMIFLFRSDKQQRFWMKNTLIPLDLIFVDRDRVVVGVVANAEPRTLTSRFVEGESRFVVEVNAGWAAAHGVTAGVAATFDRVPVDSATVD